eukprot:TRINITY_DN18096_c0_g1_i1.p1 TRINITY_DN18096_c0_g1~~TRINITY_DN18096_c0_g1_i1.p1  ORF type:complete len:641 (+),score=163.96 TRINITY_DN18096_c0_g1_i1:79-1923(+)
MPRWTLGVIEERFSQLDEDEEKIRQYFGAEPAPERAPPAGGQKPAKRHRFVNAGTVTSRSGLLPAPPPAAEEATQAVAARCRRASDAATFGWDEDSRKQHGGRRVVASLVTEGERVRRLVAEDVTRRGAVLRKGMSRPLRVGGTRGGLSDAGGSEDGEDGEDAVPPGREGGWDLAATSEMLFGTAEQGELFRCPPGMTVSAKGSGVLSAAAARRAQAMQKAPGTAGPGPRGSTAAPAAAPDAGRLSTARRATVDDPERNGGSAKATPRQESERQWWAAEWADGAVASGGAQPPRQLPQTQRSGPPPSARTRGAAHASERFANARPRSGRAQLLLEARRRRERLIGRRPASAAAAPIRAASPATSGPASPTGPKQPRPASAFGLPPLADGSMPKMPGGKRQPRRVGRPRGPDPRTIAMRAVPREAELDDAINKREYYYLHVRIMHSNTKLQRWRFDVKVTDVTFPECPLSQTFECLRLNPTMHVVFREPNDCILSPVDDLPWVRRPVDLYRHTLRVEVTGVSPQKSKVVDTLVYYGDHLPIPGSYDDGDGDSQDDGDGWPQSANPGSPPADNEAEAAPHTPHQAPMVWESASSIRPAAGGRLGLRGRVSPTPAAP